MVGCPPRPENLFYGLLKLQDKIDQMTIAKRPTGVRLDETMIDEFKRNVRIAQAGAPLVIQPAPPQIEVPTSK